MPDKAEQIYNTLMGQSFSDWYCNRFEDHVTGGDPKITKELILTDIRNYFHLPVEGTLQPGVGFVPNPPQS